MCKWGSRYFSHFCDSRGNFPRNFLLTMLPFFAPQLASLPKRMSSLSNKFTGVVIISEGRFVVKGVISCEGGFVAQVVPKGRCVVTCCIGLPKLGGWVAGVWSGGWVGIGGGQLPNTLPTWGSNFWPSSTLVGTDWITGFVQQAPNACRPSSK